MSEALFFCWRHSKILQSINKTKNKAKYLSGKELGQRGSFFKLYTSCPRFAALHPCQHLGGREEAGVLL